MNPPPDVVVREALPMAAQWGLLGILLALAIIAIVYLVVRQFRLADEHRAELVELMRKAAGDVAAVQEKRLREAAEYAAVLAELAEQLAGNTGDLGDAAKLLQATIASVQALEAAIAADAAPDPPRRGSRGGSKP